jgi:hypothetical protein
MRYGLFIFLGSFSTAMAVTLYESEPINYYEAQAVNSVANYFSNGAVDWERQGYSGYLNDFLATFDIPKESQVLGYSKPVCR